MIAVKEAFLEHVASNYKVTEEPGGLLVQAPFLDRNNDFLAFSLAVDGANWVLTDEGQTITDLPFQIEDSPVRLGMVDDIIRGLRVTREGLELKALCTDVADLGLVQADLVQAMLMVTSLEFSRPEKVHEMFQEDVARVFEARKLDYKRDVSLAGRFGLSHHFEFLLEGPGIYVQTANRLSEKVLDNNLLHWADSERPENSALCVVYNSAPKKGFESKAGLLSQQRMTVRNIKDLKSGEAI